jgi:hypothetical protein
MVMLPVRKNLLLWNWVQSLLLKFSHETLPAASNIIVCSKPNFRYDLAAQSKKLTQISNQLRVKDLFYGQDTESPI